MKQGKKKGKNLPVASTKPVGDFIYHNYHSVPHVLENIFHHLTSPFDVESCRLVSKTWMGHVDNEELWRNTTQDGKIWAQKETPQPNIQKVHSLPAVNSTQGLIFDPDSQRAVLFHSRKCYHNNEHTFAKVYFNFMQPNQISHLNPDRPWTERKEHDGIEHNIKMVSQEKQSENAIQMYHQNDTVFLKDYITFLADNMNLYFLDQTPCTTWVPTHAILGNIKKITKLEDQISYSNGLIIATLYLQHDAHYILNIKIIRDFCYTDASINMVDTFFYQQIPGPYTLGPGYGPGLQLLGNFGVISVGLGNVFIFRNPSIGSVQVELNPLDVSIGDHIDMSHLKFSICDGRYIIITGKVFQTKNINVIRCYDAKLEKIMWTRIYPGNKIKHCNIGTVFCSGAFVFWTISSSNYQRNGIETTTHAVHCYNTHLGKHLNTITMPETNLKIIKSTEFSDEKWLELSLGTFGITRKCHYKEKGKCGYFIDILSVVHGGAAMKISKSIDIQLHNNQLKYEDVKVKFLADKSGLNIYYYRTGCPRYQLKAISLKKEVPKYRTGEVEENKQGLLIENVTLKSYVSQN